MVSGKNISYSRPQPMIFVLAQLKFNTMKDIESQGGNKQVGIGSMFPQVKVRPQT